MALDRQSIERRDFPVGRRGYDPRAVDAHLSALADEIEEYRQAARRRGETVASSASEQVRTILQAAESSAAEIEREAETEAREIREEAASEARATREQASEEARQSIGSVSEATNAMLGRLSSIENELESLMASLREGAARLAADLQLLETDLAGVNQVVVPRGPFEPEAAAEPGEAGEPAAPEAWNGGDAGFVGAAGGEDATVEVATPQPAAEAYELQGVAGESSLGQTGFGGAAEGEETDDTEGARLIALNMALNGTPREETERYLTENFRLSDAGGLLDEVYASVEG